MPWGNYWIAPWMFFGPLTTFLLMMICMVSMSHMTSGGTMRHFMAKVGPIWLRFSFASNDRDRLLSSKKIAAKTLPRSDREQREPREFAGRLRAGKDIVSFDFVAGRGI